MIHACPDCGRPNAAHRSACIYCGGKLSQPTGAPPEPVSLPADIDQLVRSAMSLGTTAGLERALADHQAAAVVEDTTPAAASQENPLEVLLDAAQRAIEAERLPDARALSTALMDAKRAIERCEATPAFAVQSTEIPAAPTILLPSVQRRYALVIDGLSDVDRASDLAQTLGVDGVTARMLAIARQPRIALRADTPGGLGTMAKALQATNNLAATVVDDAALRSCGPARLLVSFDGGPRTIAINDWMTDLPNPIDTDQSQAMHQAPLLVVPGELVILQFRSAPSGGRLKHLREGRMDPAAEQRLAVADLHMPDGVIRILEGVSDLTDAPGAISDGFRLSLRVLLDQWQDHGIRVLEARTAIPKLGSKAGRTEAKGASLAAAWPEWEEHSRCARLLFMGIADEVPG
jgi:hypothetical protein